MEAKKDAKGHKNSNENGNFNLRKLRISKKYGVH